MTWRNVSIAEWLLADYNSISLMVQNKIIQTIKPTYYVPTWNKEINFKLDSVYSMR